MKMTLVVKNKEMFSNNLFGDLTVLLDADNIPWFVGKQVAEKLGYVNTSKALSDHCKGANEMLLPSAGGNQNTKVIPEKDLYRLIMRSKLDTDTLIEVILKCVKA